MKEKTTIDKVLRYIKRKTKTTEDGKEVVSRLHAKLAAKMAFEGGRQSVIDNIPELEWKVCPDGIYAISYFGNFYIMYVFDMGFVCELSCYGIKEDFSDVSEAIRKANNLYKGILIKALGL
jgi:hypothetical protein